MWYNVSPGWLSSINVLVTDNGGSAIATVSYRLATGVGLSTGGLLSQNVNQTSYSKPWKLLWSDLSDGTNDVYIRVTDNALNAMDQYIFHVKKDVTVPSYDLSLVARSYRNPFATVPEEMSHITINFYDWGGAFIRDIDYAISINTILTGPTINWYPITSNYNASTLDVPWKIDGNRFLNGTSDVYVRLSDYAGNAVTSDVCFSIFRSEPGLTYNMSCTIRERTQAGIEPRGCSKHNDSVLRCVRSRC